MNKGLRWIDYIRTLPVMIGAVLGVVGLVMTFLGVDGKVEWILEAVDLKSRLSNASPGLCFAIVGLVLLYKGLPSEGSSFDLRSIVESRFSRLFYISADVRIKKVNFQKESIDKR
jgi:hypothetical protein